MAAHLGVNDHHQAQVVNFMRFSRYQRGLRLRAVDACFEDLKQTRLDETTYTIDEVTEMLDGLLALVQGEVDTELVNMAHTNILLMRQMFQQAEKWHLKLQADISELENRELLEKIADFEEREFAGTKRDTDLQSVLKAVKLVPLNESGGTALLHMRIEELEKDSLQLQERIKSLQSSGSGSAKGKQFDDSPRTGSRSGQDSGELDDMRRKMAGLESSLDKNKKSGIQTAELMEGDLAKTKHELLRIQEMLEMAEKELDKKVSQTTPFKNLKKMLQKKNEQMKDLRKRLAKYESPDD